ASGGIRRPGYFVQQVTDAAGHMLYRHQDAGRRVLDAKVANDVTYAMEPVADYSGDTLAGDRPSAAKTGPQQFGDTGYNSDAWMVGFTRQLSTAVWVGSDPPGPLKTAAGGPVYGRGLPGATWKAFMDTYLAGQPVLDLPADVEVHAAPPPPPTTAAPTTAPPTRHSAGSSAGPSATTAAPTIGAPPTPTATPPPTPTPTITVPVPPPTTCPVVDFPTPSPTSRPGHR